MNRISISTIILGFALWHATDNDAHAIPETTGCANTDMSCTLAELINDGASFDLADKTFDNFQLAENSDFLDNPFDLSNFVLDLDDMGGLDPGPGFSIDWFDFPASVAVNGDDAVASIGFQFDVTVSSPDLLLKDISIGSEVFSSCSVAGDDNVACVASESMFVPVDQGPEVFSINSADGSGFSLSNLVSTVDFSPVSNASFLIFHRTECIGTFSGGGIGTCNFANSFVDYRFSQTTTTTPPPSHRHARANDPHPFRRWLGGLCILKAAA